MANLSRGGIFRLVMFNCKALDTHDVFTDVVRSISNKYGHVILGESMRQGDEVGRMGLESENLLNLVESNYRKSKNRISRINRPGDPVAQVSVNVRPAFVSTSADFTSFYDDLFMTMVYTEYAQRGATFSITLPYSRRNISEQNMVRVIEPLMQFYVNALGDFTPTLDPTHCWISEIDEQIPKITREPKGVPPINIIFWGNYFSNEDITKEFSNFILSAPVGISRDEKGGVWYQLHQDFMTIDQDLSVEIIDKADDYFSKIGIEYVFWRKV
jgi:hypothetical protein